MFSSGRFLFKSVDSLPRALSSKPSVRHCKTDIQIDIPARIERGPTDILKALAATVNVDPTAFHYKFPDDPYFYPYAEIDKKVYALTMESGRKSAKWIIKENPGFFKTQLADPPIKAFLPEVDRTSETECTESALVLAIEERQVLHAMKIYDLLKKKNQEVTASTKQNLLELVCFYNCEEKPDLEPEEKWLEGALGKAGANVVTEKYWKSDCFAERLYKDMDSGCSKAASAFILGLLKYKEIDKAWSVFEETKVRNMKLSVDVYNFFLSQCSRIFEHNAEISGAVKDILGGMMMRKVKPNLGTLNAALKSLLVTNHADTAARLVKEFLKMGIQPSLGSYGYLFVILTKLKDPEENAKSCRILVEELFSYIENQEHEILHPADFEFFVKAMRAFADGSPDPDLALRLHEMYLKPSNRKFIVKSSHNQVFYKLFVSLMFNTKPIDFAMNIHRRYALTVFSLDSAIFKVIISAIRDNHSSEYLPEIWEHVIRSNLSKSRPVLEKILELINIFADESSMKVFHNVAIKILQVIDEEQRFASGDEDLIPLVLLALVKNDDEKRIGQVFDFLENQKLHFTNMSDDVVKACFAYGINKKNVSIIVGSLKLAQNEQIYSVGEMAKQALPFLTGSDETWARALVPLSASVKETAVR